MLRCKLSLRNPAYGGAQNPIYEGPKTLCRERFQTVPYDVRCNKPAPRA
jgi:hypothetical protein